MKSGRSFSGKPSPIPVCSIIILIALALFAGCSESTSPDTSGGNGDTPPTDWPVIPQPSAPYEDTEST